jgi:hypothetical protein
MGIPETQLEIWAKQGATASATAIYDRIQRALKADPNLFFVDLDVFLQGSYRNHTNIRGDSDVDVVVKLNQTFMPDYSRLDPAQTAAAKRQEEPANYSFFDFRKDVATAIANAFKDHKITEGGKSIKIPRTRTNIPADVVPCLTYRQYVPLGSVFLESGFVEGIWLMDVRRRATAISFPKQHYTNGVAKNEATNGHYKPCVRMFKNIRGRLEANGIISRDSASSHSVECLLYNIPSGQFGSSYQATYFNAVNWLSSANLSAFLCQNGVQPLFAPGRWTEADARKFIGGLIRLWNDWG